MRDGASRLATSYFPSYTLFMWSYYSADQVVIKPGGNGEDTAWRGEAHCFAVYI
jgi:hypothetical protein